MIRRKRLNENGARSYPHKTYTRLSKYENSPSEVREVEKFLKRDRRCSNGTQAGERLERLQ